MKTTDASIKEWKALYQAAAEFREIEPWEWVSETDIFGVQNPLTGEIGYCCIMGEMGEVLAIAVYLGTEGLQGYIDILEGRVEPGDPDTMFIQDCLMVSFEDKNGLEKEDKALIKKLGLTFRGKKTWPLFRRYEPGYVPWFMNRDEVQYLLVVLQQAKEVCLRLKEDEKLLCLPKKGLYLTRVPGSGIDIWEDSCMKRAPLKKTYAHDVMDELRMQRIKKNAKPSAVTWELDFFYAPTPIEGERPYYPYAIMIADSDTGFIHDVQLSDKLNYSAAFPDHFLSCIEKTATVPSKILVRKEEVAALLQPIIMKLDIEISKVSKLPGIDNARRSMTKHFQVGDSLPDEYCGDDVMEEYLEKAGSELSIFGLYGLLYGCHAAPNLVKPSELIPVIFGKEGAQFESNKEAQILMGNIMDLWNFIGQWNPETEDLLIPEFEYTADVEGIIYRIYDALALMSFFLKGLELGGITYDDLIREMKEDAESLARTTALLYAYAELFKNEKEHDPGKIEEAMKSIGNGEFVIAGCIANINIGLKEARLRTVKQLRQAAETGQKGLQAAGIKIGRNNPCPCGSGKKYKKCCGLIH